MRTALLALAGSGCITALHVTAPATVADREPAPAFTLPAQDGAPVGRRFDAAHTALVVAECAV